MGEEDGTSRLRRRMVLLRTATLGVAAPTLAGCVVAPPGTSVVYAPGPARTGISDADPSDAPGHGRGGYVGNRVRTGLTDADPSDGPGYGRGGYRGVRRVTDTDPSDAPGRGRGW
jgi:hypothetical protein